MEGVFKQTIMKAKFSHVMNDDITGITYLFFKHGDIQLFSTSPDIKLEEPFCIHLNSADQRKLEAALRNEPYDCTCFNQDEMEIIKNLIKDRTLGLPPQNGNDFVITQPESMPDQTWKEFLNKLS